ncbi:MAG: [FeFe] hydrogenase H-cluster radical SAM maturase HydE [bacterium]
MSAHSEFQKILYKAEVENSLSRGEICAVLETRNPVEIDNLFNTADRMRQRWVGDEVHVRGLIEISNHCRRDCLYCGLRKSNLKLERYRMTDDEIIETVRTAASLGARTIVIQSGEDPRLTSSRVAGLVGQIKDEVDVAITLSLGEYSPGDFIAMKRAGADRYLLKHETIDRGLYNRLHPDMDYENRICCLEWLKEAGFQVGAGIMVGLPGQTIESIADDILFMKFMELDMAGIGPFIPHPETPLCGAEAGTLEMTLKVIAITRIIIPCLLIPATTAIGTIEFGGRECALRCGANVIMPNATPQKYRKLYQIYPNRICADDSPENCLICVEGMIKSLGRNVATDFGHSYQFKKSMATIRDGKKAGVC